MTNREIDALIAAKVMGLCHEEMWGIMDYREDGSPVLMPDFPPYSSDIAAAWQVVEKLRDEGLHSCVFQYADNLHWSAQFDEHELDVIRAPIVKADTAPMAICLAALKAVQRYSLERSR